MTAVINRFSGLNRYLSNFSPYSVVYRGVKWPTAEHAFQAAKAVDYHGMAPVFAAARSPEHAKRIGRTIRMRPDWNDVRVGVMLDIVRIKFTTHPGIAQRLLETGDARLVEGNDWHDQFWGDCVCGEFRCSASGENRLGLVLEQVRAELAAARTA